MKKMIYTRDDGGVSVIMAAPKDRLEIVLGPLTDEEYEAHVIERSIPPGKSYRLLEESDIPNSREFRNAWVDVTPDSKIDISCEKAVELKLVELRRERNITLAKTDIDMTRALENNDTVKIDELKTKRQGLRDLTTPLKALNVKDKYNDSTLLQTIKDLSAYTDEEAEETI